MPRKQVDIGSIRYTVSPDDEPPRDSRLWGLVVARLVDELTGQPPVGAISLTSDIPHAVARVAEGEPAGLVGVPRYAVPTLASTDAIIPMRFEVPRFTPRVTSIVIPKDPTFPDSFTPPSIHEISLHREPVVIGGRITRLVGSTHVPVDAASVVVTSVWRALPPSHATVLPSAPNLASLSPPIYLDRGVATAQLERIDLTPILSDAKRLLDATVSGQSAIRLSDVLNISIGDLLLIDTDDPDASEILKVTAIHGGLTPDETATVTVAPAPLRPHRRRTVIHRLTVGAVGPFKSFIRNAFAGDACVVLGDVTGLDIAKHVRISGGGSPHEFHAVQTLVAQSGANGYYRLPPITRVAQMSLRASLGLLKHERDYQPDYSVSENRLDFQLK